MHGYALDVGDAMIDGVPKSHDRSRRPIYEEARFAKASIRASPGLSSSNVFTAKKIFPIHGNAGQDARFA